MTFAKVLYALVWRDGNGTSVVLLGAASGWGKGLQLALLRSSKKDMRDMGLKQCPRCRSCGKPDPGRCRHRCARLLLSHHTGS